MKRVKLIFGLLMLTVFSLSFVMNNSSNLKNESDQAIDKTRIKIPTHG